MKTQKTNTFWTSSVFEKINYPKVNHILLTLPNPNNEMLKEIDKELYHFLWGCKVHKIKKKYIVIQDYRLGGGGLKKD